jgi:phosphotransferase system enzyme I (PtsP)
MRSPWLVPLLEQAIQLSDSAQIRKIFTNYLESLGLQSFVGKKA